MEIRTCEEYVLNELHIKNIEVDDLYKTIKKLTSTIEEKDKLIEDLENELLELRLHLSRLNCANLIFEDLERCDIYE